MTINHYEYINIRYVIIQHHTAGTGNVSPYIVYIFPECCFLRLRFQINFSRFYSLPKILKPCNSRASFALRHRDIERVNV